MSEIECPKCHRIDFEARRHCAGCTWTIRPTPVEGTPYGFDVLIEVRKPSLIFDTVAKHYKGSEAKVRQRAKTVSGFSRVLALVPLSEAQWINAYGEGRM
jgi:hypothetical protein